ncbi:hypothetical protein F5884DRAFT_13326 [Xylogone sp. PMI_703]|nr:hypothetical protein F5884DRAFT_13326 [Xylogone sp. PMI_703]
MENGKYVDGSLYFYAPNKGAPVVFAVLFLISACTHLYQCIRYKCFKVTGLLPWACTLFVTGYILREVGAWHYDYHSQGNINLYIATIVMLYAGPPLYELANYMILSRILYYVPYNSPIHPGRVLTTFGALSSVVEALTGNGAAYSANSSLPKHKQDIGKALIKASLILQLVVLFLFVFLASWYHRKCIRAKQIPQNLSKVLHTLYLSTTLVGIRTIYRTVEYFSSASIHVTEDTDPSTFSAILRYEWFFYVFEATLMVINSFLLNFRHPMRFLPRNNKIYLAQDGVTEIEGAGYDDNRFWLLTVFDPFDLVGMCRGRNMERKFWEMDARNNAAASVSGGEVVRPHGKEAGNEV